MLTLSARHEDRAKRKALNAAEAEPVARGADHLSPIVEMIATVNSQVEALSSEERAEVEARLRNAFEPSEGFVASDPATTYAGIGIVNPFMATSQLAAGGSGTGQALSNLTPEQIQALADEAIAEAKDRQATEESRRQAAEASGTVTAWGSNTTDPTVNADGKALTRDELKAILDGRSPPVKYEGDANLATLQGLVKGQPAA